MFTVVTLRGIKTKKPVCVGLEHCETLDSAIAEAINQSSLVNITTDDRLIRTTVEEYGKYRHFAHDPGERGQRALIVIPGYHNTKAPA